MKLCEVEGQVYRILTQFDSPNPNLCYMDMRNDQFTQRQSKALSASRVIMIVAVIKVPIKVKSLCMLLNVCLPLKKPV